MFVMFLNTPLIDSQIIQLMRKTTNQDTLLVEIKTLAQEMYKQRSKKNRTFFKKNYLAVISIPLEKIF